MAAQEQYRRLVEAVELEDLSLMELYHRRDEELRFARIDTKLEIRRFTVKNTKVSASVEFFLRAVPLDVEAAEEVEETEQSVVDMRMVWRLDYELRQEAGLDAEFSEELIQEFLHRNVPINVWPYIRETVSSVTAKMGVDATPIVLPTLKIVR